MEQQLSRTKNLVVENLRREILTMQGFKKPSEETKIDTGLGPIEHAFPGRVFPIGAVHECTSQSIEHVASTNGFLSGIVGRLMKKQGSCVWVCSKRTVYPPALKLFGIDPDRIIFIETSSPKEILWTIEEALKCDTWGAVVGEVSQLSFTESRRLQLAVEQSQVTGFIHRINARSENTVACVSRWKIRRIGSSPYGRAQSVGLPRWNVQLTKVRNGLPGSWDIEWTGERFRLIEQAAITTPSIFTRKVG